MRVGEPLGIEQPQNARALARFGLHAFRALQRIEELEADLVLARQEDIVGGAFHGIAQDRVRIHHAAEFILISGLAIIRMVALCQHMKDAANGVDIGGAAQLQHLIMIGLVIRVGRGRSGTGGFGTGSGIKSA